MRARFGQQHQSVFVQRVIAAGFTLFAAAEILVGALISSALLVDGCHNLVDAGTFGLNAKAAEWSKLDEYSTRRCYWAPATIKWVALVTAAAAAMTGVIAGLHLERPLIHHPDLVLGLAIVSFALNMMFGRWLHVHSEEEALDEGSSTAGVLHLASDAAAAAVVVGAMLLVLTTSWQTADPLGGLISAVILVAVNGWIGWQQQRRIDFHRRPDHVHPGHKHNSAHVH